MTVNDNICSRRKNIAQAYTDPAVLSSDCGDSVHTIEKTANTTGCPRTSRANRIITPLMGSKMAIIDP
jgi:hypothetical protein